jgi:hypothetical protein
MKTSIVKSVREDGNFTGKYGETYKYEIVMENGDSGVYNSKSSLKEQIKFKEGESIEYETFEQSGYPRIKPAENPDFKGNTSGIAKYKPDQDAIIYSVALKEAREIIAMDGWDGYEEMKDKIKHLNDIAYQIARLSKENIEKLKTH